jgi:hypothetical protein
MSTFNQDTTLEVRDSATAAYFETSATEPTLGRRADENYFAK